jgi:taurine dioxygenase
MAATVDVQLDLRPVTAAVGAEIRGLDLSQPLAGAQIESINDALTRYGVVFITGQQLDTAGHVAFSRQLGEIKPPSPLLGSLEGFPEVGVIATGGEADTHQADVWHSDVTWMPLPPRYSILHMQLTPPAGGDTLWASMYAAYDALSNPMKEFLRPLTALHETRTKKGSAVHPVVIENPHGRKALFVNPNFTIRINELTEAESKAILELLAAHGTRPDFTCRWRWTEGDVAIWHNHYVWHYATGDYYPASRRIHRTEIVGEAPVAAT